MGFSVSGFFRGITGDCCCDGNHMDVTHFGPWVFILDIPVTDATGDKGGRWGMWGLLYQIIVTVLFTAVVLFSIAIGLGLL